MSSKLRIEDKLMTTEEVCDFIRISRQCLLDWIADGKIDAYHPGPKTVRFRQQDVLELLSPERRKS
jgi:excisionase family DNA binding protein